MKDLSDDGLVVSETLLPDRESFDKWVEQVVAVAEILWPQPSIAEDLNNLYYEKRVGSVPK
jgi:hypothetical protein